MGAPQLTVQTMSAAVATPVVASGSAPNLHYSITVTNGAGGATLGSLISGGIPTWQEPNTTNPSRTFSGIHLAVATGVTDEVRLTFDGQTPVTGASPLGYQIPASPSFFELRSTQFVTNNTIKLISSAASTKLSLTFIV